MRRNNTLFIFAFQTFCFGAVDKFHTINFRIQFRDHIIQNYSISRKSFFCTFAPHFLFLILKLKKHGNSEQVHPGNY